MAESPDYGDIDIPSHIDDAVDSIVDWIEGTTIDVLELNTLFGRLAELAEYIDGDAIDEAVDRCPSTVQ